MRKASGPDGLFAEHLKFGGHYRSVPLIRPPFCRLHQPKVGGGLTFEYAISLEYKPPPQSFMRSLRTLPKFMHVYIRTVTKGFYTKQLIQTRIETTVHGHHITKLRGLLTSKKRCQFNVRSITFTTTSL